VFLEWAQKMCSADPLPKQTFAEAASSNNMSCPNSWYSEGYIHRRSLTPLAGLAVMAWHMAAIQGLDMPAA
jgi:hypothetical protein